MQNQADELMAIRAAARARHLRAVQQVVCHAARRVFALCRNMNAKKLPPRGNAARQSLSAAHCSSAIAPSER
jgi:hypothetical protein